LGERRVFTWVLSSASSDGGEVFPVDGVVDVSSEVELDGLSESRHLVVVEIGFSLLNKGKIYIRIDQEHC
jgi:hypothetical protein